MPNPEFAIIPFHVDDDILKGLPIVVLVYLLEGRKLAGTPVMQNPESKLIRGE